MRDHHPPAGCAWPASCQVHQARLCSSSSAYAASVVTVCVALTLTALGHSIPITLLVAKANKYLSIIIIIIIKHICRAHSRRMPQMR